MQGANKFFPARFFNFLLKSGTISYEITSQDETNMKNKLIHENYILPSRSNRHATLSLAAAIDIFMDMAMEHAELLNVGITEFNKHYSG